MTVTVERIGQKVAGEQREELKALRCIFYPFIFLYACMCESYIFHSQCGQGVQCVEGSGVHGGDLVVVE